MVMDVIVIPCYNMPIQLLHRPVLHYIQYMGFAACDDIYDVMLLILAYTAATHGAIIIVSSCCVISAGAPLS